MHLSILNGQAGDGDNARIDDEYGISPAADGQLRRARPLDREVLIQCQ